MNELLNRIFGLPSSQQDPRAIGFSSPEAHAGFYHPLPAWAMLLIVLAIIALVWWSYRSLPGGGKTRVVLALSRVLLLVSLLLLAMGPRIEQTIIRTEQDWALVLLDRSVSMNTPDASDPGSGRITRQQQLVDMVTSGQDAWSELGEHKRVLWMGFGDKLSVLGEGPAPIEQIGSTPKGRATHIDESIRRALKQAAARPISAIVLVSDGRTTSEIDPELLAHLDEIKVPIIAVPLGSDEPVRDLAISKVEHPDAVFGEDIVPIRVTLDGSGFSTDELERGSSRVELIEHDSGRVLSSAPIAPDNLPLNNQPAEPIVLMHTPDGQGQRRFDVRIVSDPPRSDLNESNNTASITLSIVDRPLRVLYIDGYPRWEQRYLKNLLLRERSIVSTSLMLSATRRYTQDGDELISGVPSTLEEWEPFDVIILGDVRSELFSPAQLESLLEHIREHGAGLLWVAGPGAVPQGWGGGELSPLLPIRQDAGGSQPTTTLWDQPVTMLAGQEAIRLGMLALNDERTGWLDRLSDPATGWSRLDWSLMLDERALKPGVSVLAWAKPIDGSDQTPLVTFMRYGAGRSIFVGTDETWRWRYGRGEDLPERFWLPIVRALGRGTVDRRAAPAQLYISPETPAPDQPSQITLRVFDQQRIDALPERVLVRVRPLRAGAEPESIELVGSADTRVGTWVPSEPGPFEVIPEGLDLSIDNIQKRVEVLDQSDERRRLDTDHALLESIAESSGGWSVPADSFSAIPDQLPNRARTIASPPRIVSLWDRPIVLIVLVLLASVEWIGRRVLRLA